MTSERHFTSSRSNSRFKQLTNPKTKQRSWGFIMELTEFTKISERFSFILAAGRVDTFSQASEIIIDGITFALFDEGAIAVRLESGSEVRLDFR
jgi:hypothetical protein